MLLYEDGNQFVPGTVEYLILREYKEELEKDYKGIVPHLCTEDDFNLSTGFSKYESESQSGQRWNNKKTT